MKYPNILLIDDDEDDQEIFIAALKDVSDSVICTVLGDANEALQKLVAKDIVPDVIFLDLNMPVMNGQQFLVTIKSNMALKDIRVIIFSTSSHPATIQLTKQLGASDFITKPNKYNDLVNILSNFCAENQRN
ncbi:MAG: response regulator [Ferruginibacter sp.]